MQNLTCSVNSVCFYALHYRESWKVAKRVFDWNYFLCVFQISAIYLFLSVVGRGVFFWGGLFFLSFHFFSPFWSACCWCSISTELQEFSRGKKKKQPYFFVSLLIEWKKTTAKWVTLWHNKKKKKVVDCEKWNIVFTCCKYHPL